VTSMRKLNRRLARWRRYAARTYWNPRVTQPGPHPRLVPPSRGHCRALDARDIEQERRFWVETPEIWLGGSDGERALIADVLDDYRCCTAGDDGHPGPCVTTCTSCGGDGDGRCPECSGLDDLGCYECDGSGSCPDCWGQGEHVEDVYVGRPVETINTGGLL
jgi:hypothetical protein